MRLERSARPRPRRCHGDYRDALAAKGVTPARFEPTQKRPGDLILSGGEFIRALPVEPRPKPIRYDDFMAAPAA